MPKTTKVLIVDDHRVVRDDVLKLCELFTTRKVAVKQKVRDFDESRLCCKLFDGITPIPQHTFVAIDIGDRAVAARRGNEARVVGKNLGLSIEAGDIDRVRSFGAGQNLQIDGLACIVEREGGFSVRHLPVPLA